MADISMSKYNHEYATVTNQTKRFFASMLQGRSVDAQVRQLLPLITTLFITTVLFFAAGGNALARPLFATVPPLGTAASFAVLGDSTVTNAGSGGTIVTGDLGVSPGNAVTGFQPTGTGVVNGTIYAGGPIAAQAQADASTAYTNLTSQACDFNYAPVAEIGGLTLTPGVHCFPTSVQVTGIVTLDAEGGDPTDVFVFKIGSTLVTANNAQVLVINSNNQACNVGLNNLFWAVGSSATIAIGTEFAGNIIAFSSNTVETNASVDGRVISLGGAVTLDTNLVSRVCITPPTITSDGGGDTASITRSENNTAVTTVTATGDPIPTYSITGGTDVLDFDIDNTTGALTFVAPPDFEAPTDSDLNNIYEVVVRATNSEGTDEQTITVTITDIADMPPTITSDGGGDTASITRSENNTAVTTVTATGDPIPTYSITGGTDVLDFDIDNTTGALTFVAPPDFEAPTDSDLNNIYEVVVRATNSEGTDEQTITVTITSDDQPAILDRLIYLPRVVSEINE